MVTFAEVLKKREKLVLSLEVTPPDRGRSIGDIFKTVEELLPFNPQFINVTYHQPHVMFEETPAGIVRRPTRKKPGTVGICAAIRSHFKVETVPHIICGGFNKYETEDALIDLHFLGFENVFVVRGDPPPGHREFVPEKDGHRYAADLVAQIAGLNKGRYLDKVDNPVPTSFCIGVAGYPEKHYEAPNLDSDLRHLKAKVDAGAEYIITQMFFKPELYVQFVEKARAAGITVPIIPGIKPITTKRQIELVPKNFFVELPNELTDAIEGARTAKEAFEKGTRFVADLAYKLIEGGAPGLHVFTMGQGTSTKALLEIIFGING